MLVVATSWNITAVWSAPWSAISRWVWALRSEVKSKTNESGYWVRIGSVFGSQFGFFSKTSLVVRSQDFRLYGPMDTKSCSYLSLSYLAFGTGVVVGKAARNGNSGCAAGSLKTMVLSSGTVTSGGTSPWSGVHLPSGSRMLWMYCGPSVPSDPIEIATPNATSLARIGEPSSYLSPSRRW